MELILQGWLDTDNCGNIIIKNSKNNFNWNCKSLSYLIMDYFNYMRLRRKITIEDAHFGIWFSDEECTLEEAQKNFESICFVGYFEYTIEGFNIVDDLIIDGHNLDYELKEHVGQYVHFILPD